MSLKDMFFRPFNHSDRLPLILLQFISMLLALLKRDPGILSKKAIAPVTKALPPDSFNNPSFSHPKTLLILVVTWELVIQQVPQVPLRVLPFPKGSPTLQV